MSSKNNKISPLDRQTDECEISLDSETEIKGNSALECVTSVW